MTMHTETGLLDNLVEIYQEAERQAASERGNFSLFGLFERADAPGRFDLVAAAPWLSTGREGILALARYLPSLVACEATLLGRIVVLDPGDDFVQTLNALYPEVQRVQEFFGQFVAGVQILHGYLMASQKQEIRTG